VAARFTGSTVVVKYGGNAMLDNELKRAFAADMVFLRHVGIKPVVVHGGGPQISAMLKRLGIASEFKGGLRVPPGDCGRGADGARRAGRPGARRLINEHGPHAVGMSGEGRGCSLRCGGPPSSTARRSDIGQVGDVEHVNIGAVADLIAAGRIPVVSTGRAGRRRRAAQPQRRHAAGALAIALGRASSSCSPTSRALRRLAGPGQPDLAAHRRRAEALLPTLERAWCRRWRRACARCTGGVPAAHVVDGRVPHSILLEVFTSEGSERW
jgi:acetylglutamate kinase